MVGYGIIKVAPQRIACHVDQDFARYYRQLIYFDYPNLRDGLSYPRHGLHITLGQPKLHVIDQAKANLYHNKRVEFYYNPTRIYVGGLRNGFVGFYLNITSPALQKIREDVLIKDLGNSYLHLSLCTSKGFHKNEAIQKR
jgi:hypothetical protein